MANFFVADDTVSTETSESPSIEIKCDVCVHLIAHLCAYNVVLHSVGNHKLIESDCAIESVPGIYALRWFDLQCATHVKINIGQFVEMKIGQPINLKLN